VEVYLHVLILLRKLALKHRDDVFTLAYLSHRYYEPIAMKLALGEIWARVNVDTFWLTLPIYNHFILFYFYLASPSRCLTRYGLERKEEYRTVMFTEFNFVTNI
jgi:hypothetical protein